jgi:hypothetical protein
MKSRLDPVLFQTRYPVFTVVEQVLVPFGLVTVKSKAVLMLAVNAAVVHEPPPLPRKVVHVPLVGENVPFAGPSAILQVSVEVEPLVISAGLAERVQVGAGVPPLLDEVDEVEDVDDELLEPLLELLPDRLTVMEKDF